VKLVAPPSWPEKGDTFYRDLAVLAFPTPPAWNDVPALPTAKLSCNFSAPDLSILNSSEQDKSATNEIAAVVAAGNPVWVQWEFPSAVTCRSVRIAGAMERDLPDDHRATVLASEDGQHFRKVMQLSSYLSDYASATRGSAAGAFTHAIPTTKSRFFRLAWTGPAKLKLRRVRWSAEPCIDAFDSRIGERAMTIFPEPTLPNETDIAVALDRMVDLTGQLDATGNLSWTAPAGNWTVVRVGYRNTGARIAPAPAEVKGLVCDVFSREAVAFHFDQYAGAIIRDAATVKAKALDQVIVDSWEESATPQNWSPVFREEFRKRRGYDVLKYLPAFAGYIVGDRERTDRLLRDVRQTMSDLVSEHFYGQLRESAHRHGMKLAAESSGGSGSGCMVTDGVQPYLYQDVPMNEGGWPFKEAVSAAHLTGKPVVAMEAFTATGWQENPASLKPRGDAAFCAGVTRLVFHTCAHNPDLDKTSPGPAFGPYGLAFIRGQTWWEMSRAWLAYIARCQFMLQRGQPATDVLYFYGEEPSGPIPTVLRRVKNRDQWPELPKGFDFDLLPAEILIKALSVRDGKLTLPDGTAYRLLVLRDSDKMTPEAAAKIKTLVRDGATVLGPKPCRSPSLADYQHCDEIVRNIADEVWGDCDGKTITHHDYGKGRVFWGTTLPETLAAMRLPPDFVADGASKDADIRFIHRRDGDAEIYFVANVARGRNLTVETIEAQFRVTGKKPELWDPVAGKITDAPAFRLEAGRIVLPLHLSPGGSMFVVFRSPLTTARKAQVLKETMTLPGPWSVAFEPGWGTPESVTFPALTDWTARPEPGIKFYSGTATYRTTFDLPAQQAPVLLDLGAVQVIAEVKLNGKNCGIAWTPPYSVEVTDALRPGRNELEVRVANTWMNRLLGEGRVPGATRHAWTTETSLRFTNKDSQPLSSGLLGPVTIQSYERTTTP
jgi:hypothetical protein